MPTLFRTLASIVVAPISITKTWFFESGESLPLYLRNRSALIEEMSILRSELAATGGERHTISTLAKENEELRRLLGDEGEERVLAGVIARPGVLPYDALMIDQGTSDGIVEGAPVYISDNTVIGIVRSAAPQTAIIELITSPEFTATVYIVGPNIYTRAVGIGGGQLRVGVPQGIPLHEGDMVLLPSITSGVYGAISVVQSEPSQPEQYGFVSPRIPLSSIRFVSVGTTPMQSVSFEEAQVILEQIKTNVFTVPVPEGVLVDVTSTTTVSTSTDTQIASSTATTTQ